MKKFSNVTSAAARHPRAAARIALTFVASILVVLLAMMAMASGPNGAMLFAQEESPTPDPTGPAIQLINPNATSDPVIAHPAEPAENPKISDRYDGTDTAYHIVAVTRQAPAGAIVEAEWAPEGENAQTIGQMTRVAGSPDTWEYFWDIPASMTEETGELVVHLYGGVDGGELATDRVTADLQHDGSYQDPDDAPAENTVEMVWPSNGGGLGFFKPKGGAWRTWINGTSSVEFDPTGRVIDSTVRVRLFYTVTPAGQDPQFKDCGEADPGNVKTDGEGSSETWGGTCTLLGKDLPSQVLAVVAVGTGFDRPYPSGLIAETTMESSDGHRVKPYVQDPRQMKIALEGLGGGTSASYPSSRRRTADSGCLRFSATVTDHLDRPVQGANVDVHLQGPNDQAAFGDDEVSSASSLDSNGKPPDKGSHPTEGRRYCSDGVTSTQLQGEHNVPGGADRKHLESAAGTGLDGGGAGPGQWNFIVFSPQHGFSDITAWVDDETIANEGATREADTDDRQAAEPQASSRAQWLPAPMTVNIAPRADSATVGTCNRYTVRVRAGDAVVPNINVDVHASGPNNDLDFCDPGDGTPRRAPDQPEGDNAHAPEDEGEGWHESDSPDNPQVQHTEGETDGNGNFIFGITSAATGPSEIEAWVDGEKGQDNDVRGSSEVGSTATKSWAGSAQDAEVRFVNPSGYGGSGDNISSKRDADEMFHLVARVDLPDVVEGVEFFLMDGETMLRDLGDATRVGTTDTWELFTTIEDGTYTIRAQIINTNKREDRAVEVDNTMETAELTRPPNGSGAPFSEGETTVAGVASADAEGVEFYYTKTDARENRESAQWILCGETELPTGDAPQNFEGKCALQGTDTALQVTGIAALTYICDAVTGCQNIEGEELGKERQTGDAHRVFGFEANPAVTIEPAEASGRTDTCQRFELTVSDAAGRAIPNANVDVHLTGPTDGASFCDLAGSSPRRAPTTGGHTASPTDADAAEHQNSGADTHHTEGEADEGGKFVFGVRSPSAGDSQIVGWADQNDNDTLDNEEKSDTSVMHWGGGGGGGGNRTCTIRGNGGDNTLVGTSGDDVICAGRGKDVIRGKGGNDIIRGGRGNDDIRGNVGRDTMYGGRGIDVIRGGRGADVARGHSGNDTLRGFTGKDRLFGGDDNDVISGGDHDDYLRGNRGRDLISGGAGRDNCGGGRGRDSITRCE